MKNVAKNYCDVVQFRCFSEIFATFHGKTICQNTIGRLLQELHLPKIDTAKKILNQQGNTQRDTQHEIKQLL